MQRTLFTNIGLLQTPVGSYSHKGKEQGENLKLRDAEIFVEKGIIKEIAGNGENVNLAKWTSESDEEILIVDCQGHLLTPGLVDGHTHLVFGGYRQHELPKKIQGYTYLDILREGGGILDTVDKTRQATKEELLEKTKGFLDEMLSLGVTTCEGKSGYGLTTADELKLLEVLDEASRESVVDVVPTFMGAHAIPREFEGNPEGFIDLMCNVTLPAIKEQGIARFVDVFCEDSVFNYAQSKRYLERARNLGFEIKIHADEIEAIGGTELAGELGAISSEHLIAIKESGLKAMAESGTTAMCLPATSFYLGANYAPARKMIEMGIPLAAASDFNPGSCPSLNLQFVMNLACIKYKLLPEEVLTAVTINPACAIGVGEQIGTVEVGKKADFVEWNAPDVETLCYRFGSNLAYSVIKNGKIAWENPLYIE